MAPFPRPLQASVQPYLYSSVTVGHHGREPSSLFWSLMKTSQRSEDVLSITLYAPNVSLTRAFLQSIHLFPRLVNVSGIDIRGLTARDRTSVRSMSRPRLLSLSLVNEFGSRNPPRQPAAPTPSNSTAEDNEEAWHVLDQYFDLGYLESFEWLGSGLSGSSTDLLLRYLPEKTLTVLKLDGFSYEALETSVVLLLSSIGYKLNVLWLHAEDDTPRPPRAPSTDPHVPKQLWSKVVPSLVPNVRDLSIVCPSLLQVFNDPSSTTSWPHLHILRLGSSPPRRSASRNFVLTPYKDQPSHPTFEAFPAELAQLQTTYRLLPSIKYVQLWDLDSTPPDALLFTAFRRPSSASSSIKESVDCAQRLRSLGVTLLDRHSVVWPTDGSVVPEQKEVSQAPEAGSPVGGVIPNAEESSNDDDDVSYAHLQDTIAAHQANATLSTAAGEGPTGWGDHPQ